jgi:hypothetical protein
MIIVTQVERDFFLRVIVKNELERNGKGSNIGPYEPQKLVFSIAGVTDLYRGPGGPIVRS